jgi:hypothetical protein
MTRRSTSSAVGTFFECTATHVRTTNDHAAVETAWTQKRGVEYVRAVGRGDKDDTIVRLESIHLDEQLVEGLLAFIMSATETGAAMATDCVDLIDEDDAGSVLFALLEKVANAAGADADKHLDKIRTGD